jgi:hypothetical protein
MNTSLTLFLRGWRDGCGGVALFGTAIRGHFLVRAMAMRTAAHAILAAKANQ